MNNFSINHQVKLIQIITNKLKKKSNVKKDYLIIQKIDSRYKDFIKNTQKVEAILILIKKNKLIEIINFLKGILFYKNIYKKNIFIIYKIGSKIFGNNIFPDWPGKYSNASFLSLIVNWLKNFLKIIFYFNYLEGIVVQKNDNIN